jgi:hypothetical protein
MVNRSRLLMSALSLSLIVIIVLSPTHSGAWAQSPTKTPIGEPPTKPPLIEVLPTKTPLPTEAAAPTLTPTFTPRPTSTATATSTSTPQPSATISPTPATRSSIPTSTAAVERGPALAAATIAFTLSATPATAETIVTATSTPIIVSPAVAIVGVDPPASTTNTTLPLITQALNIGGFILGLVILGFFVWLGLSRLSRAITGEIHTASLATLRLQHEAERLARREKVVFRADADVLSLLLTTA